MVTLCQSNKTSMSHNSTSVLMADGRKLAVWEGGNRNEHKLK